MKWLLAQVLASASIQASAAFSALRTSYPRQKRYTASLSLDSLRVVLFFAGLIVVSGMDPASHLYQVAGTSSSAARQVSRASFPSGVGRDKMFDPTHTPRLARKECKGKKRKRSSHTPEVACLQVLTWNARGLRKEDFTCGLLAFLQDEWPKVDIVLLTESNLRPTDLNTTLANNETWESHRLDELPGDGKIKTGGLVLLAKKKKRFKVSLLHDYRPYLISAASWSIEHPSWKQPLHVHGVYRNHAVAGRGPGASRQQKETEEQQATALRMIASKMDNPLKFSVLLGDLNLWIGDMQHPLTHAHVQGWQKRESDHKLEEPLSHPAKLFMGIVTDEELLVLNGRFGPSSASITFERTYKAHRHGGGHIRQTRTLLDYAVCHQRWAPSVKNLEIHANTARKSDHRPLHLHILCDTVKVLQSELDAAIGDMEWWEDETRPRLDTSPFTLPEDDPVRQRASALYQEHLTRGLEAPTARIRLLLQQWRTCQTLRHHRPHHGSGCRPSCPCHSMQQHLNEVYSSISAATLEAAEAALKYKHAGSKKLRLSSNVWRPGPEWRRLKAEQTQKWKVLAATDPHADTYAAAYDQHKLACRQLRAHVTEDHARWQSKRFSKISLQGPAHTMKNAWVYLKRQVGAEETSPGLPKRVKLADGTILSTTESTAEWHKTREKIGCHDDDHPGFDSIAHEGRKKRLRLIETREAAEIKAAPPPYEGDDSMMCAVSESEVAVMLKTSSKGTAPGTDGLPYELLTNGGDIMRTTLVLLYNLTWAAGLHPAEWDHALIRPLYKAKTKDPLVIEHYRAVTLVNCICKGYETILFNRTSTYLESRKDIAHGQGARRHTGTEELLYTITSAAKSRYAETGEGTYVCFIDFTLAYPSTDHNVIFTKMRDKGIRGRLWANIRHLYRNMQSRVMHPAIPQDDFFKIVSGVREGSVLSPILFIIAVDDMIEYLKARPFRRPDRHAGQQPAASGASARPHRRDGNSARSPGLWIHAVYLALLQFVDDSALVATSPEELQHMIDVIAEYCSIYRLSLNPRPGKTEVVEFMCEPSGYQYSVPTPTLGQPQGRTNLRISLGYRYLGAWIDKWLTLKRMVAEMLSSISTGTDKVAAMGGQPGGLPIRTTFQLWSSLVLVYVYSTISLVSAAQVLKIQHALLMSVNKLAGSLADPQAVLADLGLPDAITIRDLRLGTLVNRLRTLPAHMVAANLHRCLMTSVVSRRRGVEAEYYALVTRHRALAQWLPGPPPQDTLVKTYTAEGALVDPIKQARTTFKNMWKKVVWGSRQAAMHSRAPPFESAKFALFLSVAADDLHRKEPWACAPYLLCDVGPKHHLALFQFRTQASLLAAHKPGAAEEDEAVDPRCDGCDTRFNFLKTKLEDARAQQPPAPPARVQRLAREVEVLRSIVSNDPPEDWEHALFHCTKGDLPTLRQAWMTSMESIFTAFKPRLHDTRGPKLEWTALPTDLQTQLALGTQPPGRSAQPNNWFFSGPSSKIRCERRSDFHGEVVAASSSFVLQVCRALRNYKKATDADVIDNNGTWQRVHDDWDWGPLMDEVVSSEDDPDEHDNPDTDDDDDDE
jgi:hypothetical protein